MRRVLLIAAGVWLLLAAFVPASASAADGCTIRLTYPSADTVRADPSPECGPINLAVYSYAATAPGIWSPGAFAFGLTTPQTLASSASGPGAHSVELPCGYFQVDAWLSSGPPIPAAVTDQFLRDNGPAIMGSYRAGAHGQRLCTSTDIVPLNQSSLTAAGPTTGIASVPQTPAPEVRSDRTTRTPATIGATVLSSTSGSSGAGQLALSMVVAGVLVTIIFRSPLPSASTQRWTQ